MTKPAAVLMLVAALAGGAEIIDRVAVTVDDQMITQSDIRKDVRITALVNGEPADFNTEALSRSAERLVDQLLIGREMDLTRFPMPEPGDVDKAILLLKEQRFPSQEEFVKELAKYSVDERMLRTYFLKQLATLRFIDFRFSPGLLLPEEELEEHYREVFLPEWREKRSEPAPPLDEVRPIIERAVSAARADDALEEWLKAGRQRVEIRYRREAFE